MATGHTLEVLNTVRRYSAHFHEVCEKEDKEPTDGGGFSRMQGVHVGRTWRGVVAFEWLSGTSDVLPIRAIIVDDRDFEFSALQPRKYPS
jgi:hypothetical protein